MFNCRVCSNTPFGHFFGYEDDGERRNNNAGGDRARRNEIASRVSMESEAHEFRRADSTDRHRFRPRNPEEVLCKTKAWEGYLHARAKDFWSQPEALREVLMKIAQSVDKEADPILADMQECVFWHGDHSDTDGSPVLRMVKPGDNQPTDTFVTRLLVFLYADDESFEELQARKSEAFDMICAEPNCVNITHISL